MARIAGVDLPRDKKVLYALPYIFGIGPNNAKRVLTETGVNPDARVLLGTPSWPNHAPIIRGVGLECAEYPYYERGQGIIRFEDMIAALKSSEPVKSMLNIPCPRTPVATRPRMISSSEPAMQ